MEATMTKTISLQKAEGPLDELKVNLGAAKTLFGNIWANQKEQAALKGRTQTDANKKQFIRKRRKMIFMGAIIEAVLSVRAFGFIMHSALNIPYGRMTYLLDFIIGFVFAYGIIELSIWMLNFNHQVQTASNENTKQLTKWYGYLPLLIVPIINLAIFFETDDKSGEYIYLVLSVLTGIINFAVVTLASISQNDSRFDEVTKTDGASLEKLEKELTGYYKRFDQIRHRIEFIGPAFLKAYKQLALTDRELISYGVDYLFVLQERIFAGQNVDLIDSNSINHNDYPFIEQWDRVEAKQSLL